jgi:hypothetical protein
MDEEYFERIEEYFGRLRGTSRLLSPREWMLVKEWWEMGIPLELVLRGIKRAFDKFEEKKISGEIVSLAYCKHEVLATFRDYRGALIGKKRKEERKKEASFSSSALIEALSRAKGMFVNFLKGKGEGEFPDRLRVIITQLDALISSLSSGKPPSWEELDERLANLDSELTDAIFSHTPKHVIDKITSMVEKELSPYRDKMTPTSYDGTLRKLLLRELRRGYRLPRLDLFSLLK